MGNQIIEKRSKLTAAMTLVLSGLTLFACITGILDERLYNELLSAGTITQFLHFGSIAQDIIFIPLAFILAVLSVLFLIRPDFKILIIILGLTGNIFYGYGLYSMQGQYTSLYLVYLAIFSLSMYSMILGFLSFTSAFDAKITIPRASRISISIFLYFIVVMLGFIWIMRISPDIARHIPQDTYGVFVLDLGIVFPAFAISATRLIRKQSFGIIFSGTALIKTFFVCLSWGFGEWYGRIRGVLEGSLDMLMIPTVLALVSLVFFLMYMFKIKKEA